MKSGMRLDNRLDKKLHMILDLCGIILILCFIFLFIELNIKTLI